MKWKVAVVAVMLIAASLFCIELSAPVVAAKDGEPKPDSFSPETPVLPCGDPVPGGPGGGGDN